MSYFENRVERRGENAFKQRENEREKYVDCSE